MASSTSSWGLQPAGSGENFCRSGRARSPDDLAAALTGRLSYADLARYNAVQKVIYLGILLVGIVIVASGLAIWKPVQFAPAHQSYGRL